MALVLSINVCSSECSSFTFSETTGTFNSLNNTGGWGVSNPSISSATEATLDIIIPGGQVYNLDLYDTFPIDNSTFEYTIEGSVIGMVDELTDGKYTFTYTVVVSDVTYSVTQQLFVICNIECCVNTMLLNIDDLTCDCNKVAIDKYLEAYTLLLALKHASVCGNEDNVDTLLTTINKICSSTCKTCK